MFLEKWGWKKKSLTEPVDILPFVGQTLRTEKPVAPKVIPVQQPTAIPNPTSFSPNTPSNLDKPTGKYVGSHPSIKELLKKEQENISSIIDENQPRELFSEDQLKIAWKQYSLILKEQGLGTFYNALIKRNPIKRSEENYVLQLDSDIQKDYITDHMDDFLQFLRKQLRNYYTTISLEVVIQHEEEKFLTSKQKFDLLARKNPNLHIFKNRFNLDLEYWLDLGFFYYKNNFIIFLDR